MGEWGVALSMTEVTIACGDGFVGMQTRYCNEDGDWELPDRSNCGSLRGWG